MHLQTASSDRLEVTEERGVQGFAARNSLGSLELETRATPGGVFRQLKIEGLITSGRKGYPDLPVITRLIQVPRGAKIQGQTLNAPLHQENGITHESPLTYAIIAPPEYRRSLASFVEWSQRKGFHLGGGLHRFHGWNPGADTPVPPRCVPVYGCHTPQWLEPPRLQYQPYCRAGAEQEIRVMDQQLL